MAVTIGEKIKQFREAEGWTQAQLAHEMGVHVNTVSAWETGSSYPRWETVVEIFEFFEEELLS